MGISVSAATAIIFAGLFVAFGALYPVAANGFDRVSDANRGVDERALDRQNSEIALANATYGEDTLTVDLDNEGTTALAVDRTTLVVDNEYVAFGPNQTSVEGDAETTLWLPGERLTITITRDGDGALAFLDADEQPNRVLVTIEHGLQVAGPIEEA